MRDVTPPTADELAAWQAACDAATPGPWSESFPGHSVLVNQSGGRHIATLHWNEPSLLHKLAESDAIFIALARTALPRLLARVAALTADNERMREALKPFAFTNIPNWQDVDEVERLHLVGEYRRARAALAGRGEGT